MGGVVALNRMTDEERERIREQKRKELIEQHGDEADRMQSGGSEDADNSHGDSPTSPVEIDSQEHLDELTSSHDLVLVDCYADWCGPCQMMEPTIESLAAETPAVVAKVDVDRHQHIAQQLGAQGVPTFILFVSGRPTERLVGAQDRGTLDALIQQAG